MKKKIILFVFFGNSLIFAMEDKGINQQQVLPKEIKKKRLVCHVAHDLVTNVCRHGIEWGPIAQTKCSSSPHSDR
jgi:hypothetical protein